MHSFCVGAQLHACALYEAPGEGVIASKSAIHGQNDIYFAKSSPFQDVN
jgi:hypothetical protein